MTRASSYSLVSVFVSTLSVRRVLDEVLQKLVQLIQEEDCVSEKHGRCPHSLKDTVRCRVNTSPAPGSLHYKSVKWETDQLQRHREKILICSFTQLKDNKLNNEIRKIDSYM